MTDQQSDPLAELRILSQRIDEVAHLTDHITQRVEQILTTDGPEREAITAAVRKQSEAVARIQRGLDVMLARELGRKEPA